MGRLVTLDQLKAELGWDWYFTEFDSNKRPVLPCSTFPVSLAINNNIIANPQETTWLKNEIRSWVRDSVADLVLLDEIKKDYYHYWSTNNEYGSNIVWGYQIFHFSSDAEALMFKLRFHEHISEILPYDPEKEPNFIQAVRKRLVREKEWHEKVEAEYRDSTKKKDRVPLETLFTTYDEKLQKWNGETDLVFTDNNGEEEIRPDLQRRYRAIYKLREAEHDLAHILDMHSTFVPKTRF
jgi:hypothetical protein